MAKRIGRWLVAPAASAGLAGALAADALPQREASFEGNVNAPNILLIILDDVGFADTSTFGGLAQTPVLHRLAAEGLRYNRFHTAAICSPTRAALLSGRNQHRVGYGAFGGVDYPGYDGIWKKNAVSIAAVLRRNGYSTAAFGKWHNTPYQEISPVGPFDRWPTGLGFEYYYGNMIGMSSQWEPPLWRNTVMVAPPATVEQGYHFTTDITDEAIRWVRTQQSLAPQKPYLLYFATGAAHAPHHVPRDWIEQYHGRFDAGWDRLREEIFERQKKLGVIPASAELTPRPKELPAWSSLSTEQRRLYARQMEVYAAFIAHTDHQIGRLIQAVKAGPRADNTLILYLVGDNGSDGNAGINGGEKLIERRSSNDPAADPWRHLNTLGGPQYHNNYSSGWAWLGSTPFPWVKWVASHFGGTRNPLVVSWPARIKERGAVRTHFSYVTDVAPTIYEAAGITFPDEIDGVRQLPLDGVSLLESFDRADAPERHRVQYFEASGNRAIYRDGWMAAARHTNPLVSPTQDLSNADFSRDRWELYHVDVDFSQARDLAARYPARLEQLRDLFDAEARKNNVYPLGAGTVVRQPVWTQDRGTFVLDAATPPLLAANLPSLSQPHRLTVEATIPDTGASGAIIAWGSRDGGAVLYARDNRLVYENNVRSEVRQVFTASKPLPAGKVRLVFELSRTDPASQQLAGRLYINGAAAGEAALSANTTRWGAVFEIGKNSISPVSDAYQSPFEFTGVIDRVTLELLQARSPGKTQ